jgi:phosphopantetheinyl transferase (holo-ACP synthase)
VSNLVAVGMDICGIERWRRLLACTPEAEVTAFAPAERVWGQGDPTRLAIMWSLKEAVVKALGCGFDGLGWREVYADLRSTPPQLVLPPPRLGIPAWASRESRWHLRLGWLPGAVVALALAYEGSSRMASELHDASPRMAIEVRDVSMRREEAVRSEVAAAERAASLHALLGAASRLLSAGSSSRGLDVGRDAKGRPVIRGRVEPGEELLVSMSHCSGWAGAAVVVSRTCNRPAQRVGRCEQGVENGAKA